MSVDQSGPRIALIHGFLAATHMQRHLLRWVQEQGYHDARLFSNHSSVVPIADWLQVAADQGRPIALIGYSQGGFQVMKVAQVLAQRQVTVDCVASIARGGAGWLLPAQWLFRARLKNTTIRHLLNIYSHADLLGTNPGVKGNELPPQAGMTLDNIAVPRDLAVDHLTLVRCYPESRVHPAVTRYVLEPLAAALAKLGKA